MSFSRHQVLQLQSALRRAIVDCSQLCLYYSARWAAQLLNSMPDEDSLSFTDSDHAPQRNQAEAALELAEMPKFLMAKAFFDCHEFQRCAETFLPGGPSGLSIAFGKRRLAPSGLESLSERGLFIAAYALLILGEKQKTEESCQVLGPHDTGTIVNTQLSRIRSILEARFGQHAEAATPSYSEGWLEYLYGMALAKDQIYDLAKTWLLKSVSINPWNWGAWQELCCLIRDATDLDSIHSQLQPSIMAYIFSIYCRQELHHASSALFSDISQLLTIFPGCSFLQSQKALVAYRMKGGTTRFLHHEDLIDRFVDLVAARSLFAQTLVSNPMYFEFLDHYSNVLYTLDSKDTLAFTAQVASTVEPYRPETCCVIGNYYSLSNRHEEAVDCFKKALLLDRNCASAWTLLGHEYLKLENSHAAISSYMRATALNKKDYRAFFGLGQSYGFLEQPNMSLNFYRRALALRPGEMDIWRAMAACLITLSKVSLAISALIRALDCTNSALRVDGDDFVDSAFVKQGRLRTLFQLATLHKEEHNHYEATNYIEQCINEALQYCATENEGDALNQCKSLISKSQLSLVRWALEHGDVLKARHVASQMKEPSEDMEEAHKLLDTISSPQIYADRE
ncbi:cell division cycle protein-like protein 23 [Xylariaceae sp. FL0255]|nr:cell division cycle protein-like protein 23 [Xylariaceae sp. FL0255]